MKRSSNQTEERHESTKRSTDHQGMNQEPETADNLIFEDPFGDDEMEEEIIQDGMDVDQEEQKTSEVESEPTPVTKQVYRPGIDELKKDEVLDYDESAYDLYHAMTAEWPSLSLDILRDPFGDARTRYPMTMYMVAGTQASKADENQITVMKMSELYRTKPKSDEDDMDNDENDDDDAEGDPVLESRSVDHFGGVNRIRSMPQQPAIVSTWADTGDVHLYDLSKQIDSLDGKHPTGLSSSAPPVQSFNGHANEGFGMDWSSVAKGHLLTGDCSKYIYHWTPAESRWVIDKVPFSGHRDSVEDLAWSPTERTVFASCSVDQTVRIWDTRKKAGSMLDIRAHEQDVNVISWNTNVSYLLVSGSDDGSFKIWDLRHFKATNPVAHFRYHTAPITSVEWHPMDESVLAVSGADNQMTIWDMSVEEDADSGAAASTSGDLPPQLLFIHQGQTNIKELHFHPQCPGVIVSTASDGFNVFKPANIS